MAVTAPAEWWPRVAGVSVPSDPSAAIALRIGTRPSDVAKALRGVEAAVGGGIGVRATAEIANGVLHAVLAAAAGRLSGLAGAAALLRRIREGLAPLEGTCVVEHAPPGVKASLDVWGDVGPALAIMRRVKAELDPRGILNPGRFVGGI